MKKIVLYLLIVSFCFAFNKTAAQNTTSNSTSTKSTSSPIDGAWHSADNNEFLLMIDGFYSSVAQDSTGKWSEVYAGTYTVDNTNTVTYKVTHSSHAYRIGYLHTVEYNLNGESLTLKWYKKMIDANAVDITARMPKGEQTLYIKAKL